MTTGRMRDGEDWRDHAEPCPNCGKPVLKRSEHYANATMIDPGWWQCDHEESDDEEIVQ